MLTQKQRLVLIYLIKERATGRSPTIREAAAKFGKPTSQGSMHAILTRLEERGFIRIPPGKHRGIVVLKSPPVAP